uniref:Cytoplasmic dynein 2 light intermediate chain 1 n=1 Tax=Hirondellea gigas TaxID=1518452 RepID=A0A6A7G9N5_9CRUS
MVQKDNRPSTGSSLSSIQFDARGLKYSSAEAQNLNEVQQKANNSKHEMDEATKPVGESSQGYVSRKNSVLNEEFQLHKNSTAVGDYAGHMNSTLNEKYTLRTHSTTGEDRATRRSSTLNEDFVLRKNSALTGESSTVEGSQRAVTKRENRAANHNNKTQEKNVTPNINEAKDGETTATAAGGTDQVPPLKNDKTPRQAALLLVGPKGAGKTTLVYRFLDRDETPKPTLALDYTYGRKPGKVSMVKDVCHLWEIAGGTLEQLLKTVMGSCPVTALTVIVVLDLSRPEHIMEELITILHHLRIETSEAVKKASAEDPDLHARLLRAAWARIGPEHADRAQMDPFLVPLVLMGGKYDKFQDFEPESKKVLCRALRFVAHTNGASLQFFSARDAGLIKKAKELMSHFGFGTTEVKSLAQDYNRPLIIPCGSDSLQIIAGGGEAASNMSLKTWTHAIQEKFPKSETDIGPLTGLPEDPSRDDNYREPDVDNLRAQKDQELERLCREAGRFNQRYADVEL